MNTAWALSVVGAAFVVALVWAEWSGSRLRMIAKPLASFCFIGVALAAGALDSGYGVWVLVALVLSAVGDIALLGDSTPTFLGGLTSFLLGHVAYVVAFSVRGTEKGATALAVVLLVIPAVLVIRWLWPHVERGMRGPVGAYAAVISTMVAFAVGTVAGDADLRILLAAVAFYCSDLAVARDRFVAPGFSNRFWGLPLYYGAQFVFAWTVVV